MVNELHKARNDTAKLRNDIAKMKAGHEEELKELGRIIEEKDRQFDAMRLLWDRDNGDLRKLKDEIRKLQQQNADLNHENELLKESSMDVDKKQNDLAPDLTQILHRLISQCKETENYFSSLLWQPAQPQELKLMDKIADHNDELLMGMKGVGGLDAHKQMIDLVILFEKHRTWEFAMMKELVGNSIKLSQARAVHEQDLTKSDSEDALMKTGAAIRLRFWEQRKQDYPWTLCEDLSRTEDQSLIDAGDMAAYEPDVAADVQLFPHGFLAGEHNLKVFRNLYGKDLELCTGLVRRTPQFCALVNAEAIFKSIAIEESDDYEWMEWTSLCDKLWQDWEESWRYIIRGDESIGDWLPELEEELQRVREIAQGCVARFRSSDN